MGQIVPQLARCRFEKHFHAVFCSMIPEYFRERGFCGVALIEWVFIDLLYTGNRYVGDIVLFAIDSATQKLKLAVLEAKFFLPGTSKREQDNALDFCRIQAERASYFLQLWHPEAEVTGYTLWNTPGEEQVEIEQVFPFLGT